MTTSLEPQDLAGYRDIGFEMTWRPVSAVRHNCLRTVRLAPSRVSTTKAISIDTDEFTAMCPWSGLPDTGLLKIAYVPGARVLEMKSLKYYLLSYRDVGIIQEDAAIQILNDLVSVVAPIRMEINLDYTIRGGLHSEVNVEYDESK